MTILRTICATAIVATVLIPSTGAATPFAKIKATDVNGDGIISVGPEMEALEALRPSFSAAQKTALFEAQFAPGFTGIPVERMNDADYYTTIADECAVEKRFFLQDSVGGISLLLPGLATASENGASLSVTDDALSGSTSWSANGALFWLPQGLTKRCRHADLDRDVSRTRLSGFAVAPYIAFNGEGSSTGTDVSALTFGALVELQYAGGFFDLQEVSISPYYQTDFEGEANILGISASWKPTWIRTHLNGYVGQDPAPNWWWTTSAHFDYQSVRNPGFSGLAANTEYAWIGLKLGAQVELNPWAKSNGYYAKVMAQSFHDLNSGQTANLGTVGLGVYLSADQRSSLELTYKNGYEYRPFTPIDRTTLTLKLAF